MPSITEFIKGFGLPELVFFLLIALSITGIHEWRNVLGLFKNDSEKKKESTHTKE